jgi:hypothetical protein
VEEEQAEQRLLPLPADGDGSAVAAHLQRTEDPKIHSHLNADRNSAPWSQQRPARRTQRAQSRAWYQVPDTAAAITDP